MRASLNPAELTRDIMRYQSILIELAKDSTQALIDEETLRK